MSNLKFESGVEKPARYPIMGDSTLTLMRAPETTLLDVNVSRARSVSPVEYSSRG